MKTFVFLVCKPDGSASFYEVEAVSPSDAVRSVVMSNPNCRFNVINVIGGIK
jgi:hypothetical protein